MTQRDPYRGDNPKTAGQVYDLCHAWFGLGTYDDGAGRSWQQARIAEIAKLKRLAANRQKSVRQMYIAARYCKERRIPVRSAYALFAHMQAALDEDKRRTVEAQMASVAEQIAEAIEWERENYPGDDRWVGQLLRAHKDEDRKDVLKRWKFGRRQFQKS